MELLSYAPVVIPTLCRHEHFRRCLESLELCSGAERTDVYVGLDYPPSEKYESGWKMIDRYLAVKERDNKFRHLFVYRRDHNCGVEGDGSNGGLLLSEVSKVSANYIFTEDDNEFSPNFLEYINWGLQEYEHDERIYAICGYNEVDVPIGGCNVFAFPLFNAWGYGGWFQKRYKYLQFRDFSVLSKEARSFPISIIFQPGFMHAFHVLRMIHRKEFYGDAIVGCIPENERFCVFPTITKVKNYGWDGSGLHGARPDSSLVTALSRKMDDSLHFTAITKGDICMPQLFSIFQAHFSSDNSITKAILCRGAFVLWKLTGINVC